MLDAASTRFRNRRVEALVTVVLLAEAAVLGIISASVPGAALPVVAYLSGSPVGIARLDLGYSVVALVALNGFMVSVRALRRAPAGRDRRWIEYSLIASITAFLVARLNGISDVAALVPVYALTSAMALFFLVQNRVSVERGHPLLPLCFAAGVGIVPWGVIAFVQVGSGIEGDGPAVIVRVITLVALIGAIAVFLMAWREKRAVAQVQGRARAQPQAQPRAQGRAPAEAQAQGRARAEAQALPEPGRRASATPSAPWTLAGEPRHLVLTAIVVSVFAWLVVLGVVVPSVGIAG